MEINLPLSLTEFEKFVSENYSEAIIRVLVEDGKFKLGDQMCHSNRFDIVIVDGNVTEILSCPIEEEEE